MTVSAEGLPVTKIADLGSTSRLEAMPGLGEIIFMIERDLLTGMTSAAKRWLGHLDRMRLRHGYRGHTGIETKA